MKRMHLIVEVVVCPRAKGGHPSDGRWDGCHLTEVEHAELVGDEVQASEEEGLGWLKDGRNPHPSRWECGKIGHPMTKKHEHTMSSPRPVPTVGAESDQHVNICSFAVRCDRRWPSTLTQGLYWFRQRDIRPV